MTNKEIKEEMEKCKNDPYYFYSEYCRLDGETPSISEDRFKDMMEEYMNSNSPLLLIKSRNKLGNTK